MRRVLRACADAVTSVFVQDVSPQEEPKTLSVLARRLQPVVASLCFLSLHVLREGFPFSH